MPNLVFDCEVYKDYFLVAFRNIETGYIANYEKYEGHEFQAPTVMSILRNNTLVSFNGRNYDMAILMLACAGESNQRLKDASDAIIVKKQAYWSDEFKADFPDGNYGRDEFDHIDLIEVAPGQASLKIYGGRLHSRRMQDLPIRPEDSITPDLRPQLVEYCGNDLQTTIDLYKALEQQLDLRARMSVQYGIDLRSRSDAQIAEQVIRGRVKKDTGQRVQRPNIAPGTVFRYKAPPFVSFATKVLQDTLAMAEAQPFHVSGTGSVEMSDVLAKATIRIGKSVYRMGIGGLHSSETKAMHVADQKTLLRDRDVKSYYPFIILVQGLYPKQMGPRFLVVYRDIVRRRIETKDAGKKVDAESLKIVVNGTFGKLGSKWSAMYAPDLLIQTTVTGQLCLLMLIEALDIFDIPVVSANTDGVVIKCPIELEGRMLDVVAWWEQATGFETEETAYTAVYSRDVNNYVALKEGGGSKLKGAFAAPGLQKNPTNQVCVEAVVDFLELGIPIEATIRGCTDPRKFVSVRKVNGGAVKDGQFLGKAVRWYYARGMEGTINYQTSGYTVARTEGAKPLMLLPDTVPEDLDHEWYIKEAGSMLADLGWKQKEKS